MLAHAILESYLWPISPRDLAVPTHIAPVRGPLRLHRQCVGIQPQSPVGWPWLWGPQAMKTAVWGTCLAQRSAEWQQLHTTPRPNRQPYGDPVPTYQQTSISLGTAPVDQHSIFFFYENTCLFFSFHIFVIPYSICLSLFLSFFFSF